MGFFFPRTFHTSCLAITELSSFHSLMGKIKGRWIRPSEARAGWECKLEIRQDRSGRIKGVKKLNCKPNNNKFYQSVYQAVMQSSPLPTPKDKRLFDERVTITFSVE